MVFSNVYLIDRFSSESQYIILYIEFSESWKKCEKKIPTTSEQLASKKGKLSEGPVYIHFPCVSNTNTLEVLLNLTHYITNLNLPTIKKKYKKKIKITNY